MSTKQELQAANERLGKEVAALRDLLGAVCAVADTAPIAAPGVPDWKELRRATDVLRAVKVVANPGGSWAWGHATGAAAEYLRELAAEPVGYEVYAEPEGDELQDAADEDGPCMMVGCGHDYDGHSLDLERGDRLYCQRCECRRYLSAAAMRVSV